MVAEEVRRVVHDAFRQRCFIVVPPHASLCNGCRSWVIAGGVTAAAATATVIIIPVAVVVTTAIGVIIITTASGIVVVVTDIVVLVTTTAATIHVDTFAAATVGSAR